MARASNDANLRINSERLWDSLMTLAEIGATPRGGVCRLAGSELDGQARDLFRRWCEAEGCSVTVDPVGNMFARRPGENPARDAVATGSHIDSQPTGGKFDGAYGVLAGLEVLRTLNERDIRTEAPIEVCVWTNEEGARFPPAMMGSGVYAGVLDLDEMLERRDHDGESLGDSLDKIGYRGDAPMGRSFGAFFEAHIEQGPILEREHKRIGIVQGVQGLRWYDISVTGAEAHAGPTPMDMRRDALAGAAALATATLAMARDTGPDARATVGEWRTFPGSRNTVPGRIEMTLDMRHPKLDTLRAMDAALREAALALAEEHRVDIAIECIWESAPVEFDGECVAAVREGARRAELPARDIVSGAGHDAVYISRLAPTAMVFVPCEGGVSHNESEAATAEDCAAGCDVLFHAMLERAGIAS